MSRLVLRDLVFFAAVLSVTVGGPGAVHSQDRTHDADRSSGRFEKVVLDSHVTRPNELAVAPDGRVFYIEREGAVKVWTPSTGGTDMVGFIPVKAIHTSGLLGLALDPQFEENGWIYLYYAPRADDTRNLLVRYTVKGNRLVSGSRELILEVPFDRHVGCGAHSGGSLQFGPEGRLFLSVGDNTNPCDVQLSAPLDERPGHEHWDAQRTSANTMDLRGKILRIRPLPEGGYEVPAGNLFPHGALGRPEIYTMGHRNPFRIALDPKSGCLWWGDYGPSAPGSEERGTEGLDEFNRTCEPGNFGWPYFVGPNQAFRDYDFETGESGRLFDPERPVNDSPNNTGARILPRARPALIWYPSGPSERFPELGSGGRGPMGGAVYRYDSARAGPHALPPRYDGSFFAMEFMRHWIKEVRVDPNGELRSIRPFLPEMEFLRPFDMEIGPRGAIYLIEWGENYEGWFNDRARIVRIEYRDPKDEARRQLASSETASRTPAQADPTDRPPVEPRGSVQLEWPLYGGVIDLDEPIPYRIRRDSPSDPTVPDSLVHVLPQLAHDSHWHDQEPIAGAEGTVTVRSGTRHFYLEDRHARLEVRTDSRSGSEEHAGPVRRRPDTTLILQPRRKDAVHVRSVSGARRTTAGDLRLRDSVEAYLDVSDGDGASYGPLHLRGIDAVTFRVRPDTAGRIELLRDGPSGERLGAREVEPAGSPDSSTDSRGDAPPNHPRESEDEANTSRKPESWQEIRIPVRASEGPIDLYVRFTGPAPEDERLMRVDWLEFEGPGMMSEPAERAP